MMTLSIINFALLLVTGLIVVSTVQVKGVPLTSSLLCHLIGFFTSKFSTPTGCTQSCAIYTTGGSAAREPDGCLAGFKRQPGSSNCYKVIKEALNWEDSRTRCMQEGGYLAVIENKDANDFAVGYLQSATDTEVCNFAGFPSFFIAGQRKVLGDCQSPFLWKPRPDVTFPMECYTNWESTQPDCTRNESCVHSYGAVGYQWNDYPCEFTACPLCRANIF